MKKILPILLAGGSGKRIVKYLPDGLPKQFSSFFGKTSLFQQALLRFSNEKIFDKPIVITNDSYSMMVQAQADELEIALEKIIWESEAKNTAVSCLVGSYFTEKFYGNRSLLISPTDHIIKSFTMDETIIKFINTHINNNILLIGVKPKYCSTEYGYIEVGPKVNSVANVFTVKNFIEKPKLTIAKKIYNNTNFLWNTGIFTFNNINQNLIFLDKCLNIFSSVSQAVNNGKMSANFFKLDEKSFNSILCNQPFDKIYLEKQLSEVVVTKFESNWYDLGSLETINYLKKERHKG